MNSISCEKAQMTVGAGGNISVHPAALHIQVQILYCELCLYWLGVMETRI